MAANGSVPVSGPLTAAQFAADMNEELAELYNRATWLLAGVSGTNVIAASTSAWLTAYADGQRFRFKPAADNTDAVTLNVNSIGAKAVVTSAGAALVAGSLDADGLYTVTYYASDDHFRLDSSGSGASGSATPDQDVLFTSSGSFTKATYPGARQFRVTCIGPGGNGGSGPGGGGQAGGVAIKRFIPADLAASITVTIDSAKAQFGHSVLVVGNAGGNGSKYSRGSGSGTASGGDFNFTGQNGEYPADAITQPQNGGTGGSPVGTDLGRGGTGGLNGSGTGQDGTAGDTGNGYGGGGGGGGGALNDNNGGSGGAGAPGLVLVEVLY